MNNKYDLILIGTGFASSFFLKKYLEKSGSEKKVLVLERGLLYPHADRVKAAAGEMPYYYNSLENKESTFHNKNPSKPWIFDVNFGGSSNCWWACTPRFMPNDFQMKSLYGRGVDWPITYNELELYYSEAEDIMGIAGPEFTPFPKSKKYPLPSHLLSRVDKKMQATFGNTQWISQPTGRASVQVGKRGSCCSSYSCSLCHRNSKFTIQNSLRYIYEDPRVELKYGLQVYQIEFENKVAKKVIAAPTNSDSKNFTSQVFEGEIIALGANPIFNAHILLNSGDTNPLTGAGLVEQRGIFADIFIEELDNVGGTSSITANGYMLYDGAFRKDYASCLIENHNCPTVIRNEQGKWRKIIRLKFVFEALSENHNTVKLSSQILKPIVDYTESTNGYVQKSKIEMSRQLRTLLSCLKPQEIFMNEEYTDTECHILSSVKMGNTADDSVIDKHLIHHNYRNLFVLGGSAFPTITASNPTLTITALSLMSADANF